MTRRRNRTTDRMTQFDRRLDAAGVGRVLDLTADEVVRLVDMGKLPAAHGGEWSLRAILGTRGDPQALRAIVRP